MMEIEEHGKQILLAIYDLSDSFGDFIEIKAITKSLAIKKQDKQQLQSLLYMLNDYLKDYKNYLEKSVTAEKFKITPQGYEYISCLYSRSKDNASNHHLINTCGAIL